jgi:hypothetical protein
MAGIAETQRKMQECLDRLGLPLHVAWTPNQNQDKHGFIEESSRTIFLFDEAESEAWATFTHEVLEWKFRETLRPYRETINGLIEVIERTCYKRKEEFLETLPNIFKVIEEENKT